MMPPRARPARSSVPCPACGARRGRERGRTFNLRMDTGLEARAFIEVRLTCAGCGHRWTVQVRRDWEHERGVAAPHPGAMVARQERYARKLYRAVFDFPPGAFRSDAEGFAALAERYRSRLVDRFPRTLTPGLSDKYIARAASKLLARWEPPVNFLYDCRPRRKSGRAGRPDAKGP